MNLQKLRTQLRDITVQLLEGAKEYHDKYQFSLVRWTIYQKGFADRMDISQFISRGIYLYQPLQEILSVDKNDFWQAVQNRKVTPAIFDEALKKIGIEPASMQILKHEYSGNIGFFVKEYKPTGKPDTTQIRLEDGRIYFAPSIEFKHL